ncbi:MAG TPA: HAD family hydrolase [Desulfobacteraceae bacterium]|nr:HAD family hydrolase [Desulfobacteraceae bacterium]HPJ67515.1 HAD family hydrolase [Desulfobacteraceae bacterium]HPQ28886.1 HAD family hydrolase [Desulfobacteraceae bacterium]
MKRPAVFIDRDGTINEQMGYINHINRFIILDGTAEAIRILNRSQFLAIIVSNQSGVARGYFPIELVNEVHEYMINFLKKENAFIDGIYFCPHHRGGSVKEYSIPCNCRKPDTGLISKACEHLSIDMSRSYVIGDRISDIELSYRANLKGILVKTGYGLGDLKYLAPDSPFQPVHVAEDLLHAVRWIMKNERPGTRLEENEE